MRAEFIRKLMDLVEDYEMAGGQTEEFDQEDFSSWLLTRHERKIPAAVPNQGPPVNGLIAMYLSFMSRYAQFYSRRVFRDSAIYSDDDWGVLVSLYPYQKMKKTEVMRGCIMEKSSGNEVLKRMLKQGLLQEELHPSDRRSKLVELTAAGRQAFESVQSGIAGLAGVVVGDLAENEKLQLLELLNKLHRYHKPIFEEADDQEIEQMLGVTH
ncbi:MAG TPA: winged helix DNA-binding protein [Saprospiraceae bacterium]|nr:winged helix DNA-binding protein [Saprospiraceae bacterium]